MTAQPSPSPSSRNLNGDQFLALAKEGGATRHVRTLEGVTAGEDSGYMVGGKEDPSTGTTTRERRVNLSQIRGSGAIDRHLAHIRNLFPDDPNVHQGAWRVGGKLVLDASDRVADEDAARELGRSRNQDAIFDLKNARDIPLRGNR